MTQGSATLLGSLIGVGGAVAAVLFGAWINARINRVAMARALKWEISHIISGVQEARHILGGTIITAQSRGPDDFCGDILSSVPITHLRKIIRFPEPQIFPRAAEKTGLLGGEIGPQIAEFYSLIVVFKDRFERYFPDDSEKLLTFIYLENLKSQLDDILRGGRDCISQLDQFTVRFSMKNLSNPNERTGVGEHQTKNTIPRREDRPRLFDWLSMWAQVLTGVATFVVAIVIAVQLCVMKDQLEEMRSGSTQTAQLVAANKKLADASSKSTELAEKAFVANSRAWLSLIGFKIIDGLVPNTQPLSELLVNNIGKEPALKVSARIETGTILRKDYLTPGVVEAAIAKALSKVECKAAPVGATGLAIYPGNASTYRFQFRFKPGEIDDEVLRREKFLLVVGCLTYETLGEQRYSSYCGILDSTDEAKTIERWHATFCRDGIGNSAN